ncbi:MAG: hypothetical protein ACREO3_04945 [Arenimonas sp.]
MIRRNPAWFALCLAGVLVACTPAATPPAANTDAALTDPEHPGEEPAAPADAPGDSAPTAPPATASTTPEATIDFRGVAGVAFGASPDPLRTAWPGGAAPDAPVAPGLCHFLYAQPKPQESFGVAFMVEGDRFVRVDVDAPDLLAPGGGHAGMTADAVRAAYAGRIAEQPHKYVQGGKYLVVTPQDGGPARLVFEVDAAGIVTAWRLGLPPQVNYVEGCA